MKRYIRSSSRGATKNRSYKYVSDALQKLFGFTYDKYKRKSDWFDSDFGRVRYDVLSVMNSSDMYAIRIMLDPDAQHAKDMFFKLLKSCDQNDLYVSYSNARNLQVSIYEHKYFSASQQDVDDIRNFIIQYINDRTGLTKADCSIDVRGTERVEYRVEWYQYTNIGPGLRETMSWYNANQAVAEDIRSNICSAILQEFPNVLRCKCISNSEACFYLRVTF